MKFEVPLMIPAIHSIRFALKPSRSALMMGMPPATAVVPVLRATLGCSGPRARGPEGDARLPDVRGGDVDAAVNVPRVPLRPLRAHTPRPGLEGRRPRGGAPLHGHRAAPLLGGGD